jgi:hypothetical protein
LQGGPEKKLKETLLRRPKKRKRPYVKAKKRKRPCLKGKKSDETHGENIREKPCRQDENSPTNVDTFSDD